jgi:hypothetical protein
LLSIAPRAILLSGLILGLTAGSVFAGKGAKTASSIELAMVNAAVATAEVAGPNYGDTVTFNVATTATDRPYVLLNCYQDGAWVYAAQAGFWASYPWGQNFVLSASSWTGGSASCTARLGVLSADGARFRELATTSFDVAG